MLAALGGASSGAAMALILVFYGTPFNPLWWWVMGAILIAAAIVAMALAPVVEWVIDGYLSRPERD